MVIGLHGIFLMFCFCVVLAGTSIFWNCIIGIVFQSDLLFLIEGGGVNESGEILTQIIAYRYKNNVKSGKLVFNLDFLIWTCLIPDEDPIPLIQSSGGK